MDFLPCESCQSQWLANRVFRPEPHFVRYVNIVLNIFQDLRINLQYIILILIFLPFYIYKTFLCASK